MKLPSLLLALLFLVVPTFAQQQPKPTPHVPTGPTLYLDTDNVAADDAGGQDFAADITKEFQTQFNATVQTGLPDNDAPDAAVFIIESQQVKDTAVHIFTFIALYHKQNQLNGFSLYIGSITDFWTPKNNAMVAKLFVSDFGDLLNQATSELSKPKPPVPPVAPIAPLPRQRPSTS